MTETTVYLSECKEIINKLNYTDINKIVNILKILRSSHGRLFILGVGGSAANASHSVNDFRKIAKIEAYAPTDNVAELTARTNDDGWETVFINWLKVSKLNERDVVMILSVGGGNVENNVSVNLVNAIDYAKSVSAKVVGIIGRTGGYTAKHANACVIIPTVNPDNVTPHTEGIQSVLLHLIVTQMKV